MFGVDVCKKSVNRLRAKRSIYRGGEFIPRDYRIDEISNVIQQRYAIRYFRERDGYLHLQAWYRNITGVTLFLTVVGSVNSKAHYSLARRASSHTAPAIAVAKDNALDRRHVEAACLHLR